MKDQNLTSYMRKNELTLEDREMESIEKSDITLSMEYTTPKKHIKLPKKEEKKGLKIN